MPIAIPAIIGGIASVAGGAAWAAGAMGVNLLVGGIVVGAAVGAVVGGIQAAIEGGDILEGVLFGAVGGAIGGALGGIWEAGGFGASLAGAEGVVGAEGLASGATVSLNPGLLASEGAGWNSVIGTTTTGSFMGEAAAAGGGGTSLFGGLTAGEKMMGVTAVMGLADGFKPTPDGPEVGEDGLTASERTQAALAREKMAAELAAVEMQIAGNEVAPNYSREVAEINAKSAMAVAGQKSADLASQIADAKAARTEGYLREDQTRARMRDTASGVLISRKRAPVNSPSPTPTPSPSPQTPDYVA